MTSVTDNRTTELREKLTERGIEFSTDDFDHLLTTYWQVDDVFIQYLESIGDYVDEDDPTMKVKMNRVTPEQAIAATLGSERELIDLAHNAWSMALCAMQGMPIPAEWGDAVERGLRKHGIDVDGESAGFEEVD